MKNSDLTIVTIATDRYIYFWIELLESALEFVDSGIQVEWIVFTNMSGVLSSKELESRIKVTIIEQESLVWPYPTLLRYGLISENAEMVNGQILMHLDADMLFVARLGRGDVGLGKTNPFIKLIPHPGYFRPNRAARLALYLRHPKLVFRDMRTLVRYGSMGTWEVRKSSLAFVPRGKRKLYVCGGTWLGTRNEILEMCDNLSKRVNEDLSREVIAVFHDESHLNWYASNHGVEIGSPSMCFDPSYPQLLGLAPIIEAVNKSKKTSWVR
jgi:hypothetical protein